PRHPDLLSSLFFSGSAGPPDLPSFPTRRSSDLDAARVFDDVGPRLVALGARDAHVHARHDARQHVRVRHVAAPVAVERHREALRDRKSTRLNSSHVKISYAVFCLKKKKKAKWN